jgi:hypothetical protein
MDMMVTLGREESPLSTGSLENIEMRAGSIPLLTM